MRWINKCIKQFSWHWCLSSHIVPKGKRSRVVSGFSAELSPESAHGVVVGLSDLGAEYSAWPVLCGLLPQRWSKPEQTRILSACWCWPPQCSCPTSTSLMLNSSLKCCTSMPSPFYDIYQSTMLPIAFVMEVLLQPIIIEGSSRFVSSLSHSDVIPQHVYRSIRSMMLYSFNSYEKQGRLLIVSQRRNSTIAAWKL